MPPLDSVSEPQPASGQRDASADVPAASPWLVFTSVARLTVGALGMWLAVTLFIPFLILALPSRPLRIKMSNVFGTISGWWMFFCSGSKVVTHGYEEAVAKGPAIWAMNHCSLLDIPLGIWFSPSGTVGVGKKEVIYYPFFGLLYVLAGHLRVDRGNSQRAVASMRKMADFVRKNRLSIFIWPEGTRSPDGRLTRFKKGVAHLAIQTGLPIQPMVTIGTQKAWPKGPPRVFPTTVHIHFPERIDTTGWSEARIDAHIDELMRAYIDLLPPEQQPR